ncbi:hypothetical protein ACGFY6_24540 [Streptomyces sp. NPDC048387]|uniref:hypothetical protein n=1 Tax=Streptomyces sp. NPDC048387 TaxID=3365542 RepID=UPI003721164F
MSDTNRQDDWQAGVLGELTGTTPSRPPAPGAEGVWQPGPAQSAGQSHPAPGAEGVWQPDPGQMAAQGDPAPGAGQAYAVPGAEDQWQPDPQSAGQAYAAPRADGGRQPGPVQSAGPAYAAPGADGGRQPGVAHGAPVPQQAPGQGYAQPRHGQPQPYPQPQPSPQHAQPYPQHAQPYPQPGHPQSQHAHRAAPETVPVRAAEASVGKPRHGDPLVRRTLRTLRGALGASAAKAVAAETGLAAQVQQPVTTGRHIVVTSIRGGSGKTTVTALLSRTYNHFRHDPVLTLEADAALGTLPVRLGVESLRWTCADLAQIVRPSMQLTDITGYLVPLPDGGWLLPGSQGRIGAQVDVATYRTLMVALRRYFGVTVVDCETLPGEVARTALDTAHARVLTAPATAEGLASTHAVLDWLASLPVPVLPRTVVVLTVQSPHPAIDLGKAAAQLAATGAGVVVLPYDRHLASGGAVRTDLLGEGTRQAAVRLAAEVLQRAVALPAAGAAR